jgi:hypothetical protein
MISKPSNASPVAVTSEKYLVLSELVRIAMANIFQKFYQSIFGDRPKFDGNSRPSLGNNNFISLSQRRDDPDLDEIPFRDARWARELMNFVDWNPEVDTAQEIFSDYTLGSEIGDERGFAITENEFHSYPRTVAIAQDLQRRVLSAVDFQMAVDRFMRYGDCFGNLSIDFNNMQIAAFQFLPTWQTFRVEAGDLPEYQKAVQEGKVSSGQLIRFEQYRRFNDADPIKLHPITVVHWRYRQKNKYGRSHYRVAVDDGKRLERAIEVLEAVSSEIGYNPTVHTMPQGMDSDFKLQYKNEFQAKLKEGPVTHIFLENGAAVSRVGQLPSNETSLRDNVELWRSRIGMISRIPPWLLGERRGLRDLGAQPALSFSIAVGSVRMCFAKGIKQIINTELALKGIPKNEWVYDIVFPKIYTNPFAEQDANLEGIEDNDGVDKKANYDFNEFLKSINQSSVISAADI